MQRVRLAGLRGERAAAEEAGRALLAVRRRD
jgi:hypothetical protein